ncbi:MAG: OmpA family protein, partial [Janthinobacterium lividum]
CSTGANAVIIMGDGAAQFAAGLNPQLAKLGADYILKIIGSVGYSRGEDAFMAPINVKSDPTSISSTPMMDGTGNILLVKGLLVEGVLRDGDWNIALKWAGDNNIPNNPSDKTFDADAINWVNASDYNVAAADYVSGNKCEDRKEVSKGKLTGNTVHVCVNGVVTWTPGDVTVVEKRGGLQKVVSSKEYRSQMPSVIIGPGHFFDKNRSEMQSLLKGAFEGADQVKAFDASLHKAAEISAKVYGDEGGNDSTGKPYTHGAYWYKFFKPVVETDPTGLKVSLGGSAVNNLADNKILFGMDGANDNMRSTYNVFATIDKQQYPELFKDNGSTPLPDVRTIEDKTYLTGLIVSMANDDSGPSAVADTVNYAKVNTGDVISHRSYSINFATGSATPLADGEATLAQIKDQLALTGLKIKIVGYTDNTGSPVTNTQLSEARAQEVKTWLQQHGRSTFPDAKFANVEGDGPNNPVADNNTAAGKAANRRVEISLID